MGYKTEEGGKKALRYGYIRPSITLKRKNQEEKIQKYGVDEIIVDQTEQYQLKKLLAKVQKQDVVVIYSLDRLGKNLREILTVISKLNQKDVHVIGLADGFDSIQSRRIIELFLRTEKELIKERTVKGRESAKPRGRPQLINEKIIAKARQLRANKKTYREIADELQVPLSTLHYHLSQ